MSLQTPSTKIGADILSLFAGAAVQAASLIPSNVNTNTSPSSLPPPHVAPILDTPSPDQYPQEFQHSQQPLPRAESYAGVHSFGADEEEELTSDHDDEDGTPSSDGQLTPTGTNEDARTHRLFSVDGFPTPRPHFGGGRSADPSGVAKPRGTPEPKGQHALSQTIKRRRQI